MGTASHFHGADIPGMNPHFLLFAAQLLFNFPKEISVLFPSWKSTKTSRVFHQEAPIIQHPELARPQHLFPLSGVLGAAPRSVGILSVKGNLDALNLVTQFDGGAELQVHTLLHGGQS